MDPRGPALAGGVPRDSCVDGGTVLEPRASGRGGVETAPGVLGEIDGVAADVPGLPAAGGVPGRAAAGAPAPAAPGRCDGGATAASLPGKACGGRARKYVDAGGGTAVVVGRPSGIVAAVGRATPGARFNTGALPTIPGPTSTRLRCTG
jgi:hypothetical protein